MRQTAFLICVVAALATEMSIASAQTNVVTVRPDDETRRIVREVTEEKWIKKDTVLPALVGAFLAAAAGVYLARYTHRLEVEQKQKEEAEFSANVLRAIRREVEALGEIYAKGIGAELAKTVDGQPFKNRLAITQDWFTVFTANAVHLGRIDGNICRQIVTVYAMLKGLIEEFRINNKLLDGFDEVERARTGGFSQGSSAAKLAEWSVAQAGRMRALDAALNAEVKKLYDLLDKRGIK